MKISPPARLSVLLSAFLLALTPLAHGNFPAGSDLFSTATVIPDDETFSDATDLFAFSSEIGEPIHNPNLSSSAGKTAWWSWTAPESGYCTVDTLNTLANSNPVTRTVLAVYTGNSVSDLTLIISGASSTPLNISIDGNLSKVSFFAVKGRTYKIAVDGKAASNINASARNVTLRLRHLVLKKTTYVSAYAADFEIEHTGFITINTTTTGSLSGKVSVGAKTYPFAGVFSADGYFRATFLQKGTATPLPIDLLIDATNSKLFQLNLGQTTAVATLLEKVTFSNLVPNTVAGNYTTYMQAAIASIGGKGFFTLKISPTGIIKGVGNGPDGTPITFSAPLLTSSVPDGYSILAGKSLFGGKGSFIVSGILTEQGAVDEISGGGGIYVRPPSATSSFYPGGIATSFSLEGSTYTKPAANTRALSFLDPTGDGTLTLTDFGGELGGDILASLNLSTTNKFTFSSATNKPSLKLNPTTGLITGSISAPPTKKRNLKGVLTLNAGVPRIFGYATGSSQNVLLQVAP